MIGVILGLPYVCCGSIRKTSDDFSKGVSESLTSFDSVVWMKLLSIIFTSDGLWEADTY
jgi:hypothetical protein